MHGGFPDIHLCRIMLRPKAALLIKLKKKLEYVKMSCSLNGLVDETTDFIFDHSFIVLNSEYKWNSVLIT
jgi:hypothetical protein